LVAVPCFLPGRAKDLSTPPHTQCLVSHFLSHIYPLPFLQISHCLIFLQTSIPHAHSLLLGRSASNYMPYVSPACTPFQLLCLKMSAYYHVTSIISNIVTVICKSQELHLMCFRSPHISFFLLSHCQHHLPTVSSDLHTFMVLLRFAQIISVFNSLLSWRNLHVLLDFQKHKTTLVTIPFTPTRPVTNNAAGIFHKFSNLLSYLHTAYSHCLLLLPLFPSLPASSCSFHSIALSFTLHTYE